MSNTEVRSSHRKKKGHTIGSCQVFTVYNSHMGNVDLLNSTIEYHMKIRSNLIYVYFFHLNHTTVINYWKLSRMMLLEIYLKDTPMNKKKFSRILNLTLCHGRPEWKKRGIRRNSYSIESNRLRRNGI